MANLAITYQHIADILSFESSNTELEMTLSDPKFDWDNIVVEGSKHLVLPAIYCRLKSKKILHLLPDELNSYLKEITSLNRNRNLAIIEQVHLLTELFNSHNIDYVLLKGTALLVGDFYHDIAERMVGDIDILIDNNHIEMAFNLLKNNGYEPITETLGSQFFEHKHLPRLKTSLHIGAVELHRRLFVSYKDRILTTSHILLKKQELNGINIPSLNHLVRHNILNYQIADQGSLYNTLNIRSVYDFIILLRRHNYIIDSSDRLVNKYIYISALFFKDLEVLHPQINHLTKFYLFKLKHLKFYKFWNKLLKLTDLVGVLSKRMLFFLSNRAYRKAVLNDRTRISEVIRSIFKN
ncbi:nucleotidyltransferase family protein [Winogradskyella sp.]|uniref:nucleotidyltransferase family protein n=1 Tax=Winogradskyella sp. TaxID=1883156 RepID=UPI003BABB4E8